MLGDGGLAAGTHAATVDLVDRSAMSPDGPNEEYEALQASGGVLSLVELEAGGACRWDHRVHC